MRVDGVELAEELVLIIDDEPAISDALGLMLSNAGYRTLSLGGTAGLEEALEQEPAFIILDISLEHSDGVDALRILGDARYSGRIQLISGSMPDLLADVQRIGERRGLVMLPTLRKPFRLRDLRAAMLAPPITAGTQPSQARPQPSPATNRVRLDEALDRGWLEIWYQPKYDLKTRALAGAECLARVRHPSLGLLTPASFLPGAEAAALDRLAQHVIARACTDWEAFRRAGLQPRIALNVGASQLARLPLAQIVRDLLPRVSDWPGLLFEVTEEEALRDIDAIQETATQLAIYGVALSIDDFGVGYSSLSRLKDVPFQEIKLDRSLVHGSASNHTRGALCQTVVGLAHLLKAQVVAEGVERQEDLAFLQAAGCDLGQGYLLGRPMPLGDLVALGPGCPFRPAQAVAPGHQSALMQNAG